MISGCVVTLVHDDRVKHLQGERLFLHNLRLQGSGRDDQNVVATLNDLENKDINEGTDDLLERSFRLRKLNVKIYTITRPKYQNRMTTL